MIFILFERINIIYYLWLHVYLTKYDVFTNSEIYDMFLGVIVH